MTRSLIFRRNWLSTFALAYGSVSIAACAATGDLASETAVANSANDGSTVPDTTPDTARDGGTPLDGARREGSADAPADRDASPLFDAPAPDVPDTCVNEQAAQAQSVFVSTRNGSADSSCGLSSNPCSSLTLGLQRASNAAAKIMYVDTGTYNESVTLIDGITIQGGWDYVINGQTKAWRRQCGATRRESVVIKGSGGLGVRANGLASATLDTLSIAIDDRSGQSLYGVFAKGTASLSLVDVSVVVGKAGDGATGQIGAVSSTVTPPCNGDGAGGSNGETGPTGALGVFDANGYTPGGAGKGGAGGSGHCGTPASGACNPANKCVNACKLNITANGCDTNTYAAANTICGQEGTGGGAGSGGGGGEGGEGGGSSVAIYAWQSNVAISGGIAAAGAGADGGAGGPGGPGALGQGTTGADSDYCSYACVFVSYRSACELSSTSYPCTSSGCSSGTTFNGGTGGLGGRGGLGGTGGGGAGGYSYAIFAGGGANVTTNATTLAHGAGGKGNNGAPDGQAGNQGP